MQSLFRGTCTQLKFYYGKRRKPILLDNYSCQSQSLKLTCKGASNHILPSEVNMPPFLKPDFVCPSIFVSLSKYRAYCRVLPRLDFMPHSSASNYLTFSFSVFPSANAMFFVFSLGNLLPYVSTSVNLPPDSFKIQISNTPVWR